MEGLKTENCAVDPQCERLSKRRLSIPALHLPCALPHSVGVVENEPKESNREDDSTHQQNQADAVALWPTAGKIEDFLFHIRTNLKSKWLTIGSFVRFFGRHPKVSPDHRSKGTYRHEMPAS